MTANFCRRTITVSVLRVFLGLILFPAGLAKLVPHFPALIGPPWLERELAPYGLALFARFVAYSQVLVGLLLVSQRFATLGAIMALPMLLCIWVVTISLHWQGTPYVVFVLLLLNAWLLALEYHKLKFLLHDDIGELRPLPVRRTAPGLDLLAAGGVGMVLLVPTAARYSGAAAGLVGLGLAVFGFCQWRQRRAAATP